MSAKEEIKELEGVVRDQLKRLESLSDQLRKAMFRRQEGGAELEEARSRAGFFRNNHAFSKRQADLVDMTEFAVNRASMREARIRVEDLRSAIASSAASVERLEGLVRQCELTLQMARARLKSYGQVLQFPRKL